MNKDLPNDESFNEFIVNIINNQQPLDTDIQEVINKEFWNLL